jgi:hypothetical protein
MSQISEQHLRLLIRGILEGRSDFNRATQDINYYSDFEDPLFVKPDSKKNIDPARRVKQAWAMAVDMIEEDEYVEGEPPPRISRARRWIQSLRKSTWMEYDSRMVANLERLLMRTDRRGELACGITLPDRPMEGPGGWGWLGLEVDGWVTLAADDMGSLMTGYFSQVPPEHFERFAHSGTPRRPTRFNTSLRHSYILGPEDAGKLIDAYDSQEALVANWSPKNIVVDVPRAINDLRLDEQFEGGDPIGDFVHAMKNKFGSMPKVDTMGNPLDLQRFEEMSRARN